MEQIAPKKRRVPLLDEIRGLSILLMVVYHGAYDLVAIFGQDIPIFYSPVIQFLQAFFAGIFIFLSGIACRFSHNNLRRGAYAFLVGLGLTAVTFLMMRDQLILFGILHMLGSSMMLFGLLGKALDHIPYRIGLWLFLGLFLLSYWVPQGFLGIPGVLGVALPPELYTLKGLFFLGFPGPGFFSSDYFPLLPWLFLFFAGAYFGIPVKEGRMPRFFYQSHCRFLAVTGRYTLYIYVLHQPVLYLLFQLLFMVMKG